MSEPRASVVAADTSTAAWLADLDEHKSSIGKADTHWPDRVAEQRFSVRRGRGMYS